MPEKRPAKLTTTIRLDVEQREVLEAIAEREMRNLSNQITVLLRFAIDEYLKREELVYNSATKSFFDFSEKSL